MNDKSVFSLEKWFFCWRDVQEGGKCARVFIEWGFFRSQFSIIYHSSTPALIKWGNGTWETLSKRVNMNNFQQQKYRKRIMQEGLMVLRIRIKIIERTDLLAFSQWRTSNISSRPWPTFLRTQEAPWVDSLRFSICHVEFSLLFLVQPSYGRIVIIWLLWVGCGLGWCGLNSTALFQPIFPNMGQPVHALPWFVRYAESDAH